MKSPSSIQYLLNQCLGWLYGKLHLLTGSPSESKYEATEESGLNAMTLALTFVSALNLQPILALEAGTWVLLAQLTTFMSCSLSLLLILNIYLLINHTHLRIGSSTD